MAPEPRKEGLSTRGVLENPLDVVARVGAMAVKPFKQVIYSGLQTEDSVQGAAYGLDSPNNHRVER